MHSPIPRPARALACVSALALVAGCSGPLDVDLRDMGNGFDTSEAAYGTAGAPSQQAASGTTQAPSGTTGGQTAAPSQVNVTQLASNAIDRAGPGEAAPEAAMQPASAQSGGAIQHRVERGETIYTISRLYDVPVRTLANTNGLGADLAVREGQTLTIPQGAPSGNKAATSVSQPGQGSPTPTPPSSSEPLPDEDPAEASREATTPPPPPDLDGGSGASSQSASQSQESAEPAPAPEPESEPAPQQSSDARFSYPVQGPIIRAYAKNRNEGIDIGASPGTAVKAAASGSVAAITTNTEGDSIVVVRHEGGLLSVYVNLANVQVAKGDSVSQGQTIAEIPPGDPSFLHFEVRKGLNSVDPTEYLP